MYSAVSVRGVWVWVEGGVAAKCWRPPIFPARWLNKWLLLTELTRKFVFSQSREWKKSTGPISRKTAASLIKFPHLCSKITRKWVHKLISNNNHIWGCHPATTSFTQRPSVSPPATTNSIYNLVWRETRELRLAVSWTCCLSTLGLPRQDQSRWLDPKHEPN